MSPLIPTFALIFLGLLLFTSFKRRSNHTKPSRKFPPGPTPLPIIGSLHLLRHLPHRVLHKLAKTHGPLMLLRLGSVPTIVVSSAGAAEAFLKNHDLAFASRPKSFAYKVISYGGKGMLFVEYGPYWRNARKLCTMQLLSTSKTESFEYVRKEWLSSLVKSLRDETAKAVNLSRKVQDLIEGITYRIVLGCDNKVDKSIDLRGHISQMLKLGALFNVADFMPYLEPLDLQGLQRGLKKLSSKIDTLLEKIIDDHEGTAVGEEKDDHHKDFVDILLSNMNQPITSPYDDDHGQQHILGRPHIKAIIMDMLTGSLDTSSTAIEWAMSELLRHPTAMERLQQEIRGTIGLDRTVEEKDLPKFPYLDMVLKESLRLHPVGPFLFRKASSVDDHYNEDITINGYNIPKNSRIIFNQWAIGRDPIAWSENAEEFIPERFNVDSMTDFRGNDHRFMPFGSGRRGCPGVQLGTMTIRLVLAQLVHCFDWELPQGMTPNDLDMNEDQSLTMPRAINLLAVPTYRLNI